MGFRLAGGRSRKVGLVASANQGELTAGRWKKAQERDLGQAQTMDDDGGRWLGARELNKRDNGCRGS